MLICTQGLDGVMNLQDFEGKSRGNEEDDNRGFCICSFTLFSVFFSFFQSRFPSLFPLSYFKH